MECRICKKEIEDNIETCSFCGAVQDVHYDFAQLATAEFLGDRKEEAQEAEIVEEIIAEDVQVEEIAEDAQVEVADDEDGEPKSKKWLIALAIVAVAIVVGVGAVAMGIFDSPKVKLGKAFAKMYSSFSSDYLEILDTTSLGGIIEDYEEKSYLYTYDIDVDYSDLDIAIFADYKASKMKVNMNIGMLGAMAPTMVITPEHITFDIEGVLDDTLGINVATMRDDLLNSDVFDISEEDLPDEFTVMELMQESQEFNAAFTDITSKYLVEYANSGIEVEELDGISSTINGSSYETDVYEINMDSAMLRAVLLAWVDELFTNEATAEYISDYISSYLTSLSFYMSSYGIYDIPSAPEEFKAYAILLVNDFMDFYDAELVQLDKHVFVANSRVVKIRIAEGMAETVLEFAPTGNMFSFFSMRSNWDGQESEQYMTITSAIDNKILYVTLEASGGNMDFVFDMSKTKDNLTFSDEYGEITMSLDIMGDGRASVGANIDGVGVEMAIEEMAFPAQTFVQNLDYVNVLTASEQELMTIFEGLIMALYMNMGY